MSKRLICIVGFIVCAALLAFAYYLQFAQHLNPCPLCIFQRLFVAALGLVFLMAAAHNPGPAGSAVYGVWVFLLSLGGGSVAARQVWLQSLPPDQVPECGPGLNYMLESFPLNETIRMVLEGSGECAKVEWRFLGFSIAGWSLIFFVFFAIVGVVLIWKRNARYFR